MSRGARIARVTAIAVVVVGLGTLVWARIAVTSTSATSHGSHGAGHGTMDMAKMNMSEVQMEEMALRWFESNPVRLGDGSLSPQGVFADTFQASGAVFDADGNTGGPPDTVKITAGQMVLWQWIDGIHTVTSGTGASDPQSGVLFNVPHDCAHPFFSYQFDTPGLYPFYCGPHEFLGMKGYVKVMSAAEVTPISPAVSRIGFVESPSPNPGRGIVSFRFGVASRGNVRGEVFDAAGRSVAVVFDRDFEAGTFAAGWDGRRGDGSAASTGVYYLRLQGPRIDESRRVVIER